MNSPQTSKYSNRVSKLIIIALITTGIHLIAIKTIGSSISDEMWTAIGKASDDLKGERDLEKITAARDKAQADLLNSYRTTFFICTLPAGPITNPLFIKIKNRWIMEPWNRKEITKDQIWRRFSILENSILAINEISFGLLIYFSLIIYNKYMNRTLTKHE